MLDSNLEVGLLKAALQASANGIVITDADGQILWVNPAFTKMTGYELGEVRGQNPEFSSPAYTTPLSMPRCGP